MNFQNKIHKKNDFSFFKTKITLNCLTIAFSFLAAIIFLNFAILLWNILNYTNYIGNPHSTSTYDNVIDPNPRYDWLPFCTFYNSDSKRFPRYIGIIGWHSFWYGKNTTNTILVPMSHNMLIVDANVFSTIFVLLLCGTIASFTISITNVLGIQNLLKSKMFFKQSEHNSNYLWYLFFEMFFSFYIFSLLKIFFHLKEKEEKSKIKSAVFINIIWSAFFINLLIIILFFALIFVIAPYIFLLFIFISWFILIIIILNKTILLINSSDYSVLTFLPWFTLFTFNIVSFILLKLSYDSKIKMEYKKDLKNEVIITNLKINLFFLGSTFILLLFGMGIMYWQYDGMWVLIEGVDTTSNIAHPTSDYVGGEKQFYPLNSNIFYPNDNDHPYHLSFNIWTFLASYIYLLYFPYFLIMFLINTNILNKKNNLNNRDLFYFSLFQINFINSWKLKKTFKDEEKKQKQKPKLKFAIISLTMCIILACLLYNIFYMNNLFFSALNTDPKISEPVKIYIPNIKSWNWIFYVPLLVGMISLITNLILNHSLIAKSNKQ